MVSRSPFPRYSCTDTWQVGSSRAPKREPDLRTPFATPRTLPFSRVNKLTMRSASPSFHDRRTTPVSRYNAIAVTSAFGRVESTETPRPSLVLAHCVVEMVSAKVGPEDVGEDQLTVGQLPQQVVRD